MLGWPDFFRDVVALATKIISSGYRPDSMVAIARGGWVIGRILSDLLAVKKVGSVTMGFYAGVGVRGREPRMIEPLGLDVRGDRVLVVDEIVDTGSTLSRVIDHVNQHGAGEVRSAVLYVKPWAGLTPDFYVRTLDEWVVFPYEYREAVESLEQLTPDELESLGFDGEIVRLVKTLIRNK